MILRDLEDDQVPDAADRLGRLREARRSATSRSACASGPCSSTSPNRQRYFDFGEFAREVSATPRCPAGVDARELPADCSESAETPGELFEKLAQWGFDEHRDPARHDLGLLHAARLDVGQAAHRRAARPASGRR